MLRQHDLPFARRKTFLALKLALPHALLPLRRRRVRFAGQRTIQPMLNLSILHHDLARVPLEIGQGPR